jgi:HK97 family phage prohead protease
MPRFKLTDDSLDSHGTRIIPQGVSLDRFMKNPIMLYEHDSWGWDFLPIGRWEDIKIEGNAITAEAVFDESDEFAQSIKAKVEQGILSACSVGIRVMEWSDDPSYLVQGQTRPTITKCQLYEASIVAIPANENAVKMSFADKGLTFSGRTPNEYLNEVLPLLQKNDMKDTKELESKVAELEAALEQEKAEKEALQVQLKSASDLKAENQKLAEQVEALSSANKTGSEAMQSITKLKEDLQKSVAENESLKSSIIEVKIEAEQSKALSDLVFDVNSEKRNLAIKNTVVAEWSKQFKATEKEGVFIAYDKKTQSETTETVFESIRSFAKENGYVIEKQSGFDFKGQSQNSQVDASLISFEDEKSADAERRTAYQAKKAILRADFQAKGGLINSTAYYKMLAENNMISQEELKERLKK